MADSPDTRSTSARYSHKKLDATEILERYAHGPILCFADNPRLANGLRYMVERAPARFSPVILFDTRGDLDDTMRLLGDLVVGAPPEPTLLNRRLSVDLTDAIDPRRWRAPAPTRAPRGGAPL